MARLDAAKRATLPASAFAYIDSRGRRRLPIHDEAHVRNALARFNQVTFEDEAARDRARERLLKAAKRYGIVPVGFITGQLQSERDLGEQRAQQPVALPTGFVTMLMTDIEGSTGLVHSLGERYHELISDLRTALGAAVTAAGGHVVEARADELFAVFEDAGLALGAAISMQRELRTRAWPDRLEVRVRMGMHSGEPTLSPPNYIGLVVHTVARSCAAAHGGQILVTDTTRAAIASAPPPGVRFRSLGVHRLRGLPRAVTLHQVLAQGLRAKFPPVRTSR
jgi:class 3 adenylate cyclase